MILTAVSSVAVQQDHDHFRHCRVYDVAQSMLIVRRAGFFCKLATLRPRPNTSATRPCRLSRAVSLRTKRVTEACQQRHILVKGPQMPNTLRDDNVRVTHGNVAMLQLLLSLR